MKVTHYCSETGSQPVSPNALFGALLSRSPITDCVWQEHRYVPALASDGEVVA